MTSRGKPRENGKGELVVEPIWISAILIVVLLGLLGSGLWVALSLLGAAYVGLEFFSDAPVGRVMATSIWSATSSWILTALPLFIWMGEILFRSRLSEDMFAGLSSWVSRLPGGLLHVNIVGCAIFAAVSGSSAVTAATIGKISLPALKALGYPGSSWSSGVATAVEAMQLAKLTDRGGGAGM